MERVTNQSRLFPQNQSAQPDGLVLSVAQAWLSPESRSVIPCVSKTWQVFAATLYSRLSWLQNSKVVIEKGQRAKDAWTATFLSLAKTVDSVMGEEWLAYHTDRGLHFHHLPTGKRYHVDTPSNSDQRLLWCIGPSIFTMVTPTQQFVMTFSPHQSVHTSSTIREGEDHRTLLDQNSGHVIVVDKEGVTFPTGKIDLPETWKEHWQEVDCESNETFAVLILDKEFLIYKKVHGYQAWTATCNVPIIAAILEEDQLILLCKNGSHAILDLEARQWRPLPPSYNTLYCKGLMILSTQGELRVVPIDPKKPSISYQFPRGRTELLCADSHEGLLAIGRIAFLTPQATPGSMELSDHNRFLISLFDLKGGTGLITEMEVSGLPKRIHLAKSGMVVEFAGGGLDLYPKEYQSQALFALIALAIGLTACLIVGANALCEDDLTGIILAPSLIFVQILGAYLSYRRKRGWNHVNSV